MHRQSAGYEGLGRLVLLCLLGPSLGQAAVIRTVDRTDDALVSTCSAAASDCTLRGALTVAGTGDTIVFDAAVFNPGVINLGSALPNLAVNTLTVEGPLAAQPQVILDGTSAGAGTHGLHVTANSVVVRGLWLRNFGGDGVFISGAGNSFGQSNCSFGVVISTGNGGYGFHINGEAADGNLLNHFRSGTDGSNALGNGLGGVLVDGGADANQIGAYGCYGGMVRANQGPGVKLQGSATTGNLLRSVEAGSVAQPNTGHGIWIDGASNTAMSYVVSAIGNGGDGIRIEAGSGNWFDGNYYGVIHSNGGLGINLVAPGDPPNGVTPNDPGDADSGPNGLLNFPVITTIVGAGSGNVALTGSACAGCTVSLYRVAADPSGHGEGLDYITTATADGGGNWNAIVPLAIGQSLTAFAKDPANNLSEFGANVLNPVDQFTVDRTDDALVSACTAAASDCTLRGALTVAGAGDSIVFDAGVFSPGVISPLTSLPAITQGSLTIEGPISATPQVILDGSSFDTNGQGLLLASNGNVVSGLWIRGFATDGVVVTGSGNHLGHSSCTPMRGLVVTGNSNWGIRISGEAADANQLFSHMVGTDGSSALGNGLGGLLVEGGADGTGIGGYGCAGGVYRANLGPGIKLHGVGTNANLIRNVEVGSVAQPNAGHGIWMDGAADTAMSYVVSVIGNGGDGIRIEAGSGNWLDGNSYAIVHGNGGLGINLVAPGDPPNGVTPNDPGDADSGPNGLLNFPVITAINSIGAGNVAVSGSGCLGCNVYLYRVAADPSGHGEGIEYLISAAVDGSGNWSTVVPLAIGQSITAFAKDAANNVSEFSANVANPAVQRVVDRTDDALVSVCTAAANDCTLRGALTIAASGDTIVFDTGVFNPGVINVGSTLPDLAVNALTVQGPVSTQPQVILDGTLAGVGATGLRVTADQVLVRGLWLRNFGADGVFISGAGNSLGQPGCNGAVIATDNGGFGFHIHGEAADGNALNAFRSGTDGSNAFGNLQGGVLIDAGADGNLLGETSCISGAVRANQGPGIKLQGSATTGNSIRSAEVGSVAQPNNGHGVWIDGASGTTMGYAVSVIGNMGDGIRIEAGSDNRFDGNYYGVIHGNGGLGINLVAPGDPPNGVTPNDSGDADSGPNGLLNHPVILALTSLGGGNYLVRGRACGGCLVTVFRDGADPSGYGEGQVHLGENIADGFGIFSVGVVLGVPGPGMTMAAIAEHSVHGVSEFSPSINVLVMLAATQVCGNTLTEPPEQCDDGNAVSNDGCSAVCTLEGCGDGWVHTGIGEQCDDGNTINSDGCTNSCQAINPAVLFSATSGLQTSELGATDTFTAHLSVQPQASVTLNLASSDPGEGTVTTPLLFTTGNWQTPQVATLTGVNDLLGDGDVAYSIVTTLASADTNYAAVNPANIGVVNIDNDADASITMSDGGIAVAGQPIALTITVSNAGPKPVSGAVVTSSIPASVLGKTWACTPGPGSTCTASGSGNVADASVTVAVGGSVVYVVSGTVDPLASVAIVSAAAVSLLSGMDDPVPANNSTLLTTLIEGLFKDGFEN
ncbi:MAG: hypothetical protein IPH76_18390 [Xanthomonadales bacterium]|nr:hypothetical protein [Xanthomonadales bacterium]